MRRGGAKDVLPILVCRREGRTSVGTVGRLAGYVELELLVFADPALIPVRREDQVGGVGRRSSDDVDRDLIRDLERVAEQGPAVTGGIELQAACVGQVAALSVLELRKRREQAAVEQPPGTPESGVLGACRREHV